MSLPDVARLPNQSASVRVFLAQTPHCVYVVSYVALAHNASGPDLVGLAGRRRSGLGYFESDEEVRSTMGTLVLVRHGQSMWNRDGRFTGWWDSDLTSTGEEQARRSGDLLRASGIAFSCAYASVLTRAIRTLWLILQRMECVWLPTICDHRLNERHYGALTGLEKAHTTKMHGAEQVALWRRSYTSQPPPMQAGAPHDVADDRRYAGVSVPAGESLRDTLQRVMSLVDESIAQRLRGGENILIVAHGNSLRALMKHLMRIDDVRIADLEIPTGSPLVVDVSADLIARSARYLDSERQAQLPIP